MRVLLFSVVLEIIATTAVAAEASKSIYEAKARSALETLATNQARVRFLPSVTNLPPSVCEWLAHFGGIADAGQPYSDGCIGSEPRRRFLVATKADHTYTVAFEQGGFVPTLHIWQFFVDADGKIVRNREIEPGDPAKRGQPVGSGTNRTPAAVGPSG